MSEKLKYSELARCLEMNAGHITMARKRGQLIADEENKTVDIDLPLNRLWLEKQIGDGKTFDLNRKKDYSSANRRVIKPQEEKEETNEQKEVKTRKSRTAKDTSDDAIEMNRKKLDAEIRYKESQIQKTEIEIAKRKGELIPLDEAQFLLKFIIEDVSKRYMQEVTGLADMYKQRFAIKHEEYIEIKKDLTIVIHQNLSDAIETLKKSIDNITERYKEVRNRGRQ